MKQLALVVMLFVVMVGPARAAPIEEASADGVYVVLTDEACPVAEIVASAPAARRVTWTEKSKTFEGCYIKIPEAGIVSMYFPEDKSLVNASLAMFRKVKGVVGA